MRNEDAFKYLEDSTRRTTISRSSTSPIPRTTRSASSTPTRSTTCSASASASAASPSCRPRRPATRASRSGPSSQTIEAVRLQRRAAPRLRPELRRVGLRPRRRRGAPRAERAAHRRLEAPLPRRTRPCPSSSASRGTLGRVEAPGEPAERSEARRDLHARVGHLHALMDRRAFLTTLAAGWAVDALVAFAAQARGPHRRRLARRGTPLARRRRAFAGRAARARRRRRRRGRRRGFVRGVEARAGRARRARARARALRRRHEHVGRRRRGAASLGRALPRGAEPRGARGAAACSRTCASSSAGTRPAGLASIRGCSAMRRRSACSTRAFGIPGSCPSDALDDHDRAELERFADLEHALTREDRRPTASLRSRSRSRSRRATPTSSRSIGCRCATWLDREGYTSPVPALVRPLRDASTTSAREPEEISAWAGASLLRGAQAQTPELEGSHFLVWPEGNGHLVKALVERSHAKITLGALATSIDVLGDRSASRSVLRRRAREDSRASARARRRARGSSVRHAAPLSARGSAFARAHELAVGRREPARRSRRSIPTWRGTRFSTTPRGSATSTRAIS